MESFIKEAFSSKKYFKVRESKEFILSILIQKIFSWQFYKSLCFTKNMKLISNAQKIISQNIIRKQKPASPIISTFASKVQDSFCPSRSPYEILNDKLLSCFGITSEVKDTKVLSDFLGAVDNFCTLNKNRGLFNGLQLKPAYDMNELTMSIPQSKQILVDARADWRNIAEVSKRFYFDEGINASPDPLYEFYYSLADFLNFKYNPYAYNACKGLRLPGAASEASGYRLGVNTDILNFKNNYIAAKMCGTPTTKRMDGDFLKYSGNTDLVFPESKNEYFKGTNFNFKTMQEALNFLQSYGIRASLPNLSEANRCASAVCDMANAVGNDRIFQGLRIEGAFERFPDMGFNALFDCEHNRIALNPGVNWNKISDILSSGYHDNFYSTPNPKDVYTHELAHYLDFIINPRLYTNKDRMFMAFHKSDTGKIASNKVSAYAAKYPGEFCAEYVCGRMSGIQYPEIVNRQFNKYWSGPKLNFPRID